MRRKQRYIPVVAKPKNDSLDFVKTIGRLYYDKGDHKNLSRKMGAFFLEHVRSRYKLPTGTLNEEFINNSYFAVIIFHLLIFNNNYFSKIYLKKMCCIFTIYSVFCCLFNLFSLYYIVIFCNIYEKSISALFQSVYLTLLTDLVGYDLGFMIFQAIFRSIVRVFKLE